MVGAGTMGVGIAQVAALGGCETYLYEIDPKALDRGLEQLRKGCGAGSSEGDGPSRWPRMRSSG